jgi:hypothetical protein
MTEKRSYPRVSIDHVVLYTPDIAPRPRVARVIDLSLGGTRIETPYSLTKGEGLEISIAIHPQVIRCRGQVEHIYWPDGERLKAGIRFEALSKHDLLYLKGYISYVMEQRDRIALTL